MVTVSTTMDHMITLNLIDLKSISILQEIAPSPDGMNQFFLLAGVNFISQIINIDVNDIGAGIKINIPDMLGNHGSGYHCTCIAHEVFQKRVFSHGQNYFLAGSGNPV
jgi:hypothetical protein